MTSNLDYDISILLYIILAEGPGVAVENKIWKNFWFFFSLRHPRPPMSVHKKIQPNRSSGLAGYREHIMHTELS